MSAESVPRRRWTFVVTGVAALVAGTLLSQLREPGIAVEEAHVGDLPAVRIRPVPLPTHAPRALLAHGYSSSKETMFRLAEALAAAGFDCLTFDARGHGGSTSSRFGAQTTAVEDYVAAAAMVAPDRKDGPEVLVGHSMGAYTAGETISEGFLRTRLLISIGAAPAILAHRPAQTLLLLGAHDELLRKEEITRLAAELPGGSAVIAPYSDHALETFDPMLIDAAVETACRALGLPTPPPTSAWRLRLLGGLLLLVGILLALHGTLPVSQRASVAAGLGGAAALAVLLTAHVALGRTWLGTALIPERIPRQLACSGLLLAVSVVGSRWSAMVTRRPRFAALSAHLAMAACAFAGAAALRIASIFGMAFIGMAAGIGGVLVLVAGALAAAAEWQVGHPRAADAAFAVILGYALGQWIPL